MTKEYTIVPLRFFLSGKEVTRANWHKFGPEVTEEKIDEIAHTIFKIAGPIKCVTHGKGASVECYGTSLTSMEFKVEACCDELKNRVITALGTIRLTTP